MLILRRGLLRTSDVARQIALLQTLLAELGLLTDIDGDFGPATTTAVRRFQTDNDLVVDGVAGEKTWSKLVAASPDLVARISALWLSQADLDHAVRHRHDVVDRAHRILQRIAAAVAELALEQPSDLRRGDL